MRATFPTRRSRGCKEKTRTVAQDTAMQNDGGIYRVRGDVQGYLLLMLSTVGGGFILFFEQIREGLTALRALFLFNALSTQYAIHHPLQVRDLALPPLLH